MYVKNLLKFNMEQNTEGLPTYRDAINSTKGKSSTSNGSMILNVDTASHDIYVAKKGPVSGKARLILTLIACALYLTAIFIAAYWGGGASVIFFSFFAFIGSILIGLALIALICKAIFQIGSASEVGSTSGITNTNRVGFFDSLLILCNFAKILESIMYLKFIFSSNTININNNYNNGNQKDDNSSVVGTIILAVILVSIIVSLILANLGILVFGIVALSRAMTINSKDPNKDQNWSFKAPSTFLSYAALAFTIISSQVLFTYLVVKYNPELFWGISGDLVNQVGDFFVNASQAKFTQYIGVSISVILIGLASLILYQINKKEIDHKHCIENGGIDQPDNPAKDPYFNITEKQDVGSQLKQFFSIGEIKCFTKILGQT